MCSSSRLGSILPVGAKNLHLCEEELVSPMKLHRVLATLILSVVGVSAAQAVEVRPTGATTDMPVRAFFAGLPDFNNILNTIDGNIGNSNGFVSERPIGFINYTYSSPVSATSFLLWNNAGSIFTEGESIGLMDITIRDAANAVLFSQTGVAVPEAAAGDPFTISFPGTLSGIASVRLDIKANNGGTGDLDGIALRDVALNAVPEPAGLGLLGACGLMAVIRRRK